MKIQASAEDYLEAIFVLSKNKNNVRAVDIVGYMGFSRPTVSIALKQFRENDYITIDAGRNITLTDKGYQIAKQTYERHTLIAQFLMAVGVDEETALADACKMEHSISEKSFECLTEYYKTHLASK